jgi:ElaB/YqjD/DUF883 family membrane-anchored ribosome-binding protein
LLVPSRFYPRTENKSKENSMEDNSTGTQLTTESSRTDWSQGGNGGLSHGENPNEGGNPTTDKIAEVVSQAKDYLGDKVNTVGGKIKDFATDDLGGLAEKAKDFARQNPGQAILVSAAAGVLLGLLVRGRR